jgi:hypothetical protein
MSDQKILLVNEVRNKVRMRYYWAVALLILPVSFLVSGFKIPKLLPFFLGIVFGTTFFPNLITLFLLKCPFCTKRYFKPKLCSNNELNNTFKSNCSCVHCNNKAAIIAGELSDDLL